MSESLKQKAKTGFEIETEIGSLRCMNVGTAKQKIGRDKRLQTLLEEKWVLVSVAEGYLQVAQQEIDQKNHAIAEMRDYLKAAVEGAMKLNDLQLKLDEWERERGLLKQKLQPFYDTLVAMVPKTVKIEEYDKGTKESWIVQTADPSEWSMFIDSLDGWLVKLKEMLT